MTRPNGKAAMTDAPPIPTAETEARLLDRVVDATRYSVREVETMAAHVSRSRMYNLDDDQAFTLLMLAEAEGLHPIQAVRRFHVIEGKPSMRADAMQAEFQRRGGRVRWLNSDGLECRAEFWHPLFHPEPFAIHVTLQELIESEVALAWARKRLGDRWVNDYDQAKVLKDTYRKFPRQMLRARAISEGVRAIDPGVVVGIYTPEEVSDFDDRPPAPPARLVPPIEAGAAPARAAEPARQSPRGECSLWIQSRIDDAENEWASLCAKERKPHHYLGEAGRRLNVWQVINGIISTWLERDIIVPFDIETDGKRNKTKVQALIKAEWQETDEDGRQQLMADVLDYLQQKLDEATRQAGINLDSDPEEDPAHAPA